MAADTHPFVHAIARGDSTTVQRLLDAGQDPDMPNDWHKFCCVTPLAFAVQTGHLDIAAMLIARGADVLYGISADCDFSTAMSSAVCSGNLSAVTLLLENGHPASKDAVVLAMKRWPARGIHCSKF
jgi:hypothetical protein